MEEEEEHLVAIPLHQTPLASNSNRHTQITFNNSAISSLEIPTGPKLLASTSIPYGTVVRTVVI